MRDHGLTSWDLVLGPFFILFFLMVGMLIVNSQYKGTIHAKHFYSGLALKLLGCIAFSLVFFFYYGGGDTEFYFLNSKTLFHLIFSDFSRALELIMYRAVPKDTILWDLEGYSLLFHQDSTFIVVKFATLFSFLVSNTYIPIALCFAFFSFLGIWSFYITLQKIFPKLHFYTAMPLFYVPTFFFWSSSIMKESLLTGAMGFLIYCMYNLFVRKVFKLSNIFLFILSIYILYNVKQYVILSFLPSLIVWIVFENLKGRNYGKGKIFLYPLGLASIVFFVVVVLPSITRDSKIYSVDKIVQTAETTSEYLLRVSNEQQGSGYDLNVDYTTLGLIRAVPKAINVTLFRPYVWESKNVFMLISSLESLIYIVLTLYLIIKIGFVRLFWFLRQNPFLLISLVFSLFFAFAIGVSTYNFGSLVRYKVPCLPFYTLVIFVILGKYNQERVNRSKSVANDVIQKETTFRTR